MMRLYPCSARRGAGISSFEHRDDVGVARARAQHWRMPFALRARALWKSYAAGVARCSARVWVLRGASLDVERGECVAVLGARGAGTTTLLHCLAGLRRTDAGTIELGLAPHLVEVDSVCAERASTADLLTLYDD